MSEARKALLGNIEYFDRYNVQEFPGTKCVLPADPSRLAVAEAHIPEAMAPGIIVAFKEEAAELKMEHHTDCVIPDARPYEYNGQKMVMLVVVATKSAQGLSVADRAQVSELVLRQITATTDFLPDLTPMVGPEDLKVSSVPVIPTTKEPAKSPTAPPAAAQAPAAGPVPPRPAIDPIKPETLVLEVARGLLSETEDARGVTPNQILAAATKQWSALHKPAIDWHLTYQGLTEKGAWKASGIVPFGFDKGRVVALVEANFPGLAFNEKLQKGGGFAPRGAPASMPVVAPVVPTGSVPVAHGVQPTPGVAADTRFGKTQDPEQSGPSAPLLQAPPPVAPPPTKPPALKAVSHIPDIIRNGMNPAPVVPPMGSPAAPAPRKAVNPRPTVPVQLPLSPAPTQFDEVINPIAAMREIAVTVAAAPTTTQVFLGGASPDQVLAACKTAVPSPAYKIKIVCNGNAKYHEADGKLALYPNRDLAQSVGAGVAGVLGQFVGKVEFLVEEHLERRTEKHLVLYFMEDGVSTGTSFDLSRPSSRTATGLFRAVAESISKEINLAKGSLFQAHEITESFVGNKPEGPPQNRFLEKEELRPLLRALMGTLQEEFTRIGKPASAYASLNVLVEAWILA